MANNIRKEGTGGSSSLTGAGITYSKIINPFKAVCEVKIRKGIYRTEGFACTVLVKRGKTEVAHFVTLSDVARDFNKPTQIYRFSRLHPGQYWLTVDSTTVQTFGPFSFLQVGPNMSSRAASSSGKGDWEVICLAFQAPEGVNTSSLEAYSFVGSERLKLKLEFQGDTKTYKLEASEDDMQKLSRAVVGAPIIVENKQIDASNSGRWSVVGVLGLSEEGEFCPYFVSSEILGQLENTPNPSGKLEVDAPEGLHQVLHTGIQEVNDQLSYSQLSTVFSNYYEVKEEVASELSREIAGRKTWKQVASEYNLKNTHLLEREKVPGDGVIEYINAQFSNLTVYVFCKTLKKVRRLDIVEILLDHLCSADA